MDSAFEIERSLRALELHIAEGVDEWIMPAPRSRFEDAAREKIDTKPAPTPKSPPPEPVGVLSAEANSPAPVNFKNLQSEEEILNATLEALPQGIRAQLHDPLPDLGSIDAEIAVIIDPPFREAQVKGSLLGDPSISLLIKSLQAISLDLDASSGREPRAAIRVLPISPWRMPQDRKFVEAEAEIFQKALAARLALAQHRAVLLAGSNLAGLERMIADAKIFDIPAFELVSPRIMLKEPMLKRVHWERLLKFHAELDGILNI